MRSREPAPNGYKVSLSLAPSSHWRIDLSFFPGNCATMGAAKPHGKESLCCALSKETVCGIQGLPGPRRHSVPLNFAHGCQPRAHRLVLLKGVQPVCIDTSWVPSNIHHNVLSSEARRGFAERSCLLLFEILAPWGTAHGGSCLSVQLQCGSYNRARALLSLCDAAVAQVPKLSSLANDSHSPLRRHQWTTDLFKVRPHFLQRCHCHNVFLITLEQGPPFWVCRLCPQVCY